MEMKMSFNEQEIECIIIALGELPYKIAAPLIQRLNAQIAGQKALAKKSAPSGASPDNL